MASSSDVAEDGKGYFAVDLQIASKCALLRLAVQPLDANFVLPVEYIRASNELMLLGLAVTWVITASVNPHIIETNQLKNYVGYNNPCVGWDMAPANYIGHLACVVMAHFAWQYAWWDAARTQLRDDDGHISVKEAFIVGADYLYAISTTGLTLIFLVGPPNGAWGWHTFIFVQYILCKFLLAWANYLESPPEARTLLHRLFIRVYGIISVALPACYAIAIGVYEAEGRVGLDPPIPWFVTCVLDYAWVACQIGLSRLLPPEPPLRVYREVLRPGEHHQLTREDVKRLVKLGVKVRNV